VTLEARIAFVVFFFVVWCLIGLVPWAIAAVWTRGRGALMALPTALVGAAAFGVLIPVLGQRDLTGFLISLPSALAGGALGAVAGVVLDRQLWKTRARTEELPAEPAVADSGATPEEPTPPAGP
jgi:hypothetical protein